MESYGSYKDDKIAGRRKWFFKNSAGQVASTMRGRSTVYGSDTIPTANCGMKVDSSMEGRKVNGRSMMLLRAWLRRRVLSSFINATNV